MVVLDVLASLSTVISNLAIAAAIVYAVRTIRQQRGQSREPEFPRVAPRATKESTWKRAISPIGSAPEEFSRQMTPTPELGKNVYDVESGVVFMGLQEDSQDLVIKDTAEAMLTMKNVFKRLCTSSKELLCIDDVEKVHNLLGEPVDKAEKLEMIEFFGSEDTTAPCISFEKFMRWWGKLHDSSADPDEYYSQERYRQRFKVLQSRMKNPEIAKICTQHDGEETSRRFRVRFQMDGNYLSPWHDIALKNADGSYNFICEIPKWTRNKYEIAIGEDMNPIKQDVKHGVLREYKWGDMMFNYGAFPQTWEDPKHISPETGCPGDNDPIDVIELGTRQRPVGSITRVKIIGVIAMIDDDETDWKVLTIAMDDDKAVNIQDLVDLDAHMPGVTASLTHWLRMYKTAEGKGENRFGYGGKPQGKAVATRVVEECHEAWRQLLAEKQASGGMKKVASGHNLFTSLAV